MPEGHTLHRLARQMGELFVDRPWRVSSPQGRFTAGAARLDGRVPERAEAWGKHLFVHLGADVWQVHLGLYGAFSFRGDEEFSGASTLGAPRAAAEAWEIRHDDDGWIVPAEPAGAVRARIHVQHGWADLRGPATCAVLSPLEHGRIVSRLGPDPLRQPPGLLREGDVEAFTARLARRRIPIGAALMDQAVISGVGNIYRAESLFLERIDPETPAQRLDGSAVASLWSRLTEQLRQGAAEGVIRTLRPADAARAGLAGDEEAHDSEEVHDYLVGGLSRGGAAARRHWVYQHQGTPCLRCGETLAARELQGRRLYWCPGCQR